MRKKIPITFFLLMAVNFIDAQCFNEKISACYHTLVIKTDGTLWAWGDNTYGQLGDGTTISKNSPIQVGTGTIWKSISSGFSYNLAIKTDGTLWAWGYNSYGQLGDGTITNRLFPVKIGNNNSWESIYAGNNFSIAIKSDGTLWAWGWNTGGQLGDGTTTNKYIPVQIGVSNDWRTIATGFNFTLAIRNSGTLWTWGDNSTGQLGDGTYISHNIPKQVGTDADWGNICSGGFYANALKTNGTLWVWGDNGFGQYGDGTTNERNYPGQVGTANNWSVVKDGSVYTIAMKTDSTFWAWGGNDYGQFGDGTTITQKTPFQIGMGQNWKTFVVGSRHTFVLKTDGTLLGFGQNTFGQLGDETNTHRYVPTLILCLGKKMANMLRGLVFIAKNTDCIQDIGEKGMPNILMMTKQKEYGSFTDSIGKYTIYTDSGTFKVAPVYSAFLKPFIKAPFCPASGSYTIKLDGFGKDTSDLNFALGYAIAPLLQVEFLGRLRRCVENTGTVTYCNRGTGDTDNVKVMIQLPPDVSYVYASKIPVVNGKTLTFNVGSLKAGECGAITLVTKVDCINGLSGQTRCFKVAITPSNTTYKNLANKTGYDQSKIMAEAICNGNNTIKFLLTNEGQDMSDSSGYRIFKDALLGLTAKFKLKANQTQTITISATGHTYRIEADQTSLYPTYSNPNASVENCGTGASAHFGNITKLPPYEENFEYKEQCFIIRDSYDPNEKSVLPSGIGANSIVKHKIPLHYTINFQNTGNDTAYKIVVADTISKLLDLSTLIIRGSSHSYIVKFNGENATVINFIFDKINLPDSTTDEKKSHGYIGYSIMPYDTIPNGTIIKNVADIHFDYNLPVRTNSVVTTIDDRLPVATIPIVTVGISTIESPTSSYTIMPNPARNKVGISGDDLNDGNMYSIFNSLGHKVMEGIFVDRKASIDISSFVQGIYFVNVNGIVKKLMIY